LGLIVVFDAWLCQERPIKSSNLFKYKVMHPEKSIYVLYKKVKTTFISIDFISYIQHVFVKLYQLTIN